MSRRALLLPTWFTAIAVALVFVWNDGVPAQAQRPGRAERVIVELRLEAGIVPERDLPHAAAVAAQRRAIADRAAAVMARLPRGSFRLLRQYQTVPYLALHAAPEALAVLRTSGVDVVRVLEDRIMRPVLADSVPLVGADQVWANGYDGTGTVVAVLDTGVDASHAFLAGKVVEEACYSSTTPDQSQTFCPNGLDEQIGPGAGAPCPLDECRHGTHVAGIAAGRTSGGSGPAAGVGRGAGLMAVQVFSLIIDPDSCGGAASCTGAFTSDIIAGLERVYALALAGTHTFGAVNMSLGGNVYDAPCDGEPYKPVIDQLRAIGIPTVIAAGNSGYPIGLSTPGCISTAVSVGSTTKDDQVSYFSNVAPFLSLFAPGDGIVSSVPGASGGSFESLSGTSMAAPHVAGAWSIVKQAAPGASVTAVLNAMRSTGLPVTDNRYWFLGISTTVPRLRLFEALATLVPMTSAPPTITALSPSRAPVGSGPLTLTVTGTGFNGLSEVQWNGSARPTVAASSVTLTATIAAADLASLGTALVRVVTPAPGGGTSASLPFSIDPPPTLSVSASTVAPGASATVTLANGLGGVGDYLTLAAVGSPNTSYLNSTQVGTGVLNRTWTVTMPTTAGQYEFRLFSSSKREATSPPVTVDPTFNHVPTLNTIAPVAAAAGGPGFTLTLNGTRFVTSSVVRWNGNARPTTFISSTQLTAAIGAADIAAVGTAQVTVETPPPGGGASTALTFAINPPPSIAVSATTVAGGASVTATLSNGLGGAYDWLALASTTAPNTSYLKFIYIGSGVTTRAWTVAMPTTIGTYEFRLFLNNGYTRAATSPAVAVTSTAPILTSLSPASAPVGGAAFTLSVYGSGFTTGSAVRWNGAERATTFVSASQLQAAIPATDLNAAGTAQVTVAAPGGAVSAALPFQIGGAAPVLTASATTVNGGSPLTVTLTNGLGGTTDWMSFATTSAPGGSYVQYTYVGAGVTTRTWTINAPSVAGTYEFRLLPNNGTTIVARSAPVTVSVQAPVLSVNTTSAARGTPVTVTLTGGYGGSGDWMSFAATSSPNTSYVTYTYVGAGVTTRTWTVTMPQTPGTYEFRLFPNNGYTRAATSPPITVY